MEGIETTLAEMTAPLGSDILAVIKQRHEELRTLNWQSDVDLTDKVIDFRCLLSDVYHNAERFAPEDPIQLRQTCAIRNVYWKCRYDPSGPYWPN